MSRAAFHLLLERYLQGNCTEDEKRMVEELYATLDKQDLDEIDLREMNTIEQKLWDRVQIEIASPEESTKYDVPVRHLSQGMWTSIAAMIAGFLLITGYMFFKEEFRQPEFITKSADISSKEWKNRTMKPEKVVFEDGSFVILEANAVVKYPTHFGSEFREVSLEGSGFFQISKDVERPFLVYSKDVVTKVLGTSFTIKSGAQGKETEVSVETGKVMVSPVYGNVKIVKKILGTEHEVLLVPNQRAIFITARNTFEKTLVSNPEPVYLKVDKEDVHEHFSFNDAPITEVIDQLQQAYGIRFKVENRTLYDNTFTGDLSEQSLYNKLDFLCESIKATYEISGTTIVIKNK